MAPDPPTQPKCRFFCDFPRFFASLCFPGLRPALIYTGEARRVARGRNLACGRYLRVPRGSWASDTPEPLAHRLILQEPFLENLRKSGKNKDLESEGPTFITIFTESGTQKLQRTILLHFGLVTFRFHFGKNRKPLILMVFGPSGRDHALLNQFCLTGPTKLLKKKTRRTEYVSKTVSWKSQSLGHHVF